MADHRPQLSVYPHSHGGLMAQSWLLALFVLVLLPFLGIGEAHAQAGACPHPTDGGTCTQAEAWQACQTEIAIQVAQGGFYGDPSRHRCVLVSNPDAYRHDRRSTGGWVWGSGGQVFHFVSGCPEGKEFSEVVGACVCPEGSTPRPDGSCKACGEMNSEPEWSSLGDTVRPFKQRCFGGCQLRAVPMQSTCWLVSGGTRGEEACAGRFEWTTDASCSVGEGASSPASPITAPIPGQPDGTPLPREECEPASDGQTFCVKTSGDHCYTASTGRQICWKPGETGEKGDGPVLQTRGPGTNAKPPTNPATAHGDPYEASGDPVTVTTTRNGATISTTTANFVTASGTDADNQRDGEPTDGDHDSASGGGDCATPPIVSDPALAMIATQAWATRCAVEAGNAAKVTGDVGDCSSPFIVEGTNANAEKLRALRIQICGGMDGTSLGLVSDAVDGIDGAVAVLDGGDPDVSGDDVDAAADPDNWRQIRDLNAEIAELDASGFVSSRTCPLTPSVSIAGQSLGLTFQPICDLFVNMSGLLIALAYVVAARIIAGVK